MAQVVRSIIEVTPEAKSGDGTIKNVGIKLTGSCLCEECNQRFETHRALSLHVMAFHGNKVFRVMSLARDGDACVGMNLAGDEIFRLESYSSIAGKLQQQVAEALQSHITFIEIRHGADKLGDDDIIDDIALTIVRQDMGRAGNEMFDN
eukprot:gnl/MRDRNA2_/MRDRNA2_121224_c0_seq1.p1 gnl/MRDRNA2_/MRDRNA2_121224_c0~~gnl/MRDRNA2_/MRDRNA2_121224_c0_seq1.p1  ORF type:complete len:172 (-),score=41.38 gnl/MRDRNA2_/MRDRNA2_121224_c0_seq1:166-612(-)